MRIKRDDWEARKGTPEFIEQLARAIRVEGFFILEDMIRPPLLDDLRAAFSKRIEGEVDSQKHTGDRRFNVHFTADSVIGREEYIANPVILPLLHRVLGVDATCTWVAADVSLPGSRYQPPHADGRPLFRESDLALPVYALAVNVPLIDFTPDVGPTDIWPNGSHLFSDVAAHIGGEDRPAESAIMSAGSMMVRDIRMWHRGTPNNSDLVRPMLSLVYARNWFRFEGAAGETPPTVDEDTYRGWSEDTKRLFRFASVDANLTKPSRLEATMRLDQLEDSKGLGGRQKAPMAFGKGVTAVAEDA